MIKAPCKDCSLRQMRCHSTCERWIIYEKEKVKEKEVINTERRKAYEFKDAEVKRKIAEKRRKGKK